MKLQYNQCQPFRTTNEVIIQSIDSEINNHQNETMYLINKIQNVIQKAYKNKVN